MVLSMCISSDIDIGQILISHDYYKNLSPPLTCDNCREKKTLEEFNHIFEDKMLNPAVCSICADWKTTDFPKL
jgi:hypothetical protein